MSRRHFVCGRWRRDSIRSSTFRRRALWHFFRRAAATAPSLVWVDRSGGKRHRRLRVGGTYGQPRIHPTDDGSRSSSEAMTMTTFGSTIRVGHRGPLYIRRKLRFQCGQPMAHGWRITPMAQYRSQSRLEALRWERGPETIVGGKFARRAFPFSWSPDGVLAFVP